MFRNSVREGYRQADGASYVQGDRSISQTMMHFEEAKYAQKGE